MANFPIFFNDNLNLFVEVTNKISWFRIESIDRGGVRLDYHKINKKMMIGLEFFLSRVAADDETQPATLHRFIDVDPPDWDLPETLDRDFINSAILGFSDSEFDLTASVGISKNFNTPTDFGTIKANQTKMFNKTVGQVFNVAAGHNSFDEQFNFKLAAHLGTPTGDLTCKIWSLDGSNLPSVELASEVLTPVSNAVNTVTFESVNLPKGTKYAFTIQDDATNDTNNTFRIERSTEGIYTVGNYIQFNGSWTEDLTLDLVGSFSRR